MIIRIRTKDKLEELLSHGNSPSWVILMRMTLKKAFLEKGYISSMRQVALYKTQYEILK